MLARSKGLLRFFLWVKPCLEQGQRPSWCLPKASKKKKKGAHMQTFFLLMRQCQTGITDQLDLVRNDTFPELIPGILKTRVCK